MKGCWKPYFYEKEKKTAILLATQLIWYEENYPFGVIKIKDKNLHLVEIFIGSHSYENIK